MTIGPLPRMAPVTIGGIEVHSLLDDVGPTVTPGTLLRGLPDPLAGPNLRWLTDMGYLDGDSGKLRMAYQSYLVKIGNRRILIDAAVGEDGNFPNRPAWHGAKSDWLGHLGQTGTAPAQVDTVFLTHLHLDHTGWLTRLDKGAWVPTFGAARHLASQVELDYWPAQHEAVGYMSTSYLDCVAPVREAGLVEAVAIGQEIAPGLVTVDLAGHSPGMIGLELIEDGRPVAAFCADLMHNAVQMLHPAVGTGFDFDPAAARAVRGAKLAEYAAAGTVMFCNHFPGASAGRAVARDGGFRFEPLDSGTIQGG